MKNKIILVLLLAFLSLLSGILISKMSLLSKAGITFIYNEYSILKSWWKTGLIMFVIQIIIFFILSIIQKNTDKKVRYYGFPLIIIIIGTVGFYMTYFNFTETSNRLMNNSFKIGFYLFWLTWIGNSLSFFLNKKPNIITKESVDILSDQENMHQ
ncbi:hypothetical protein [Faecalibacter bovis]|uniref:Uncharacterized protein n=1 Tax=Faecalibacter bovis TaxID=2898187 RepID=A0ABX7XEW6_9FLAO|nr:hypothetical protein [Faecalibacter bovis]QTV06449.1 hypothetical protein J9309_03720 [Faecalibacter bovis]